MITDMFESFKMVTVKSTPSDFGGTTETYTDGDAFTAGVAVNQSLEMKIAEQNGVKTVYDIITLGTQLTHGDLIKRVSDSAIFRITSDSAGCVAPTLASIAYKQASAERVVV